MPRSLTSQVLLPNLPSSNSSALLLMKDKTRQTSVKPFKATQVTMLSQPRTFLLVLKLQLRLQTICLVVEKLIMELARLP